MASTKLAAVWTLAAGLMMAAAASAQEEGPSLLVRVTLLDAAGVDGLADATLTIVRQHRSPWTPHSQFAFNGLAAGKPSEWVDLSPHLAAQRNVVTATLTFSADGTPVTGAARARVELARAADAAPLATIEVSDPGGKLGMVMPERGTPDEDIPRRFASIAQIAQRHRAASRPVAVSAEDRPKRFVAVARAQIGEAYTDPAIIENEIGTLLDMGYNTLTDLSPQLAEKMKVPYVGGADYRPPGAEGPEADDAAVRAAADKHYGAIAKGLRETYGSPDRMRSFAISDEPNWDFPPTSDALAKDPGAVQRFHAYLRDKGLTPEMVGAASWDEVKPAGPPAADASLPVRRLWYHTVRFGGREQIRRYGAAAASLRENLGEQVLGYVNWNNPGIFYSDCSRWHNNPFTASHDWFDFSRAKSSTCLWLGPGNSEGGNSTFRTWSVMLTLLRSAAGEGVGRFGAYVHHNFIPDDRGYEAELSIMAVAGYGGAGYDSYIWGPHYAFTEYMWSEKLGHYEPVADANRLIGRSEHLMIGAKPPAAEVALLWPVTSQIYDLNRRGYWNYNRDFTVETQQVFFALSHHNIPADFVDETIIQRGDLKRYKALYVAGPNLEAKTYGAIAEWVRGGGRLWSSAGAGTRDEYNEPTDALDAVLGVKGRRIEKAADADYTPKGGLRRLEPLARVAMDAKAGLGEEPWDAYGTRATFELAGGEVLGSFGPAGDDGAPATPAVVRHRVGKGESLHFATNPGLAYSRGADERRGAPTLDYPERIARLITALPESLGVAKPATSSLIFVEPAVLRSDKGIAVTLLNWSGEPVEKVEVTIAGAGAASSVRSVRLGELKPARRGDAMVVTLPMAKASDVVLVEFGGNAP